MRRIVALIILIFFSVSLYALDAYYISLDSQFYDIVDDLYVLEGLAKPSGARPYSSAQAKLVLSRIEPDSLSGYSKLLYEKALSYTEDTVRWALGDTFGLGAHLEVNPEIYAHINGDDFRTENDWAYSYDDRKHFLYLGLEFSIGNYFYTYADLMYTMGRYSADGSTVLTNADFPHGIGAILPVEERDFILVEDSKQYYDAFSFNMPLKSSEFEFEWPKRAFVSFGGPSWSILFGRDRINWGNSSVSNFVIDDHVGYHDMLRLSFFSDIFSYEWTNLFFETGGTGREEENAGIRMLLAHRLEFRPLKWIDFAISENVMYKAPSLSLQYLNPGFIFHNLNNRSMFNAIAAFEINVTPLKGLDIYGQFVLDQAVAPNEDHSQADAWGLLAGLEYSFSPSEKGILSLNVEFDYTTPVLYRRDGVDFLMYQRSFTYDLSYPLKLYYIGYRYGGDVMLLHLGIDYTLYDVFSLSFTLDGILKGEMNMAKSHNINNDNNEDSNYVGSTPSGDVTREILIATIKGEYYVPSLPSWMDLSFSSSISFVGSLDYHKGTGECENAKSDVQFSLAASLKI